MLVLVDCDIDPSFVHGRHSRRQAMRALRPLWFSPAELEPSTPHPTVRHGVATVRPFPLP